MPERCLPAFAFEPALCRSGRAAEHRQLRPMEHSKAVNRLVLPVPAGPMRTEKRDRYISSSALAFSKRASSSVSGSPASANGGSCWSIRVASRVRPHGAYPPNAVSHGL